MRTLMVLLLMMVAGIAPAQTVVKCTQADGSIAYQQTACAGTDTQELVEVYAPPPPTPVRRMVQAFDPATGAPTEMWMDGPAPSTSGATYTTREMQQVFDPATGIPHQMWVDVTHPVPVAPRSSSPRRERGLQFSQPGSYYNPSQQERANNSVYERSRCKNMSSNRGC